MRGGLICVGLALAGAAIAQQYVIADLGDLGGGASFGYGINAKGQVAGAAVNANGELRAFRWWWVGGMGVGLAGLGGSEAYGLAIDSAGAVAGVAQDASGAYLPVFWDTGGNSVNLATLGGTTGTAYGVAFDSVAGNRFIVGQSTLAGDQNARGCTWDPVQGLPTLGGTDACALGVSSAGQVVGVSSDADGYSQGFLWSAAKGISKVPTLGGTEGCATAISEIGDIVGYSRTADGAMHAFLWPQQGNPLDLGTLGGTSRALAVNRWGLVAGSSDTLEGDSHAFLWINGVGMVDLNDILPDDSGWDVLYEATGVNDLGQIVGNGIIGGTTHAFLMVPLTQTVTGKLDPGIGVLPSSAVYEFRMHTEPPTTVSFGASEVALDPDGSFSACAPCGVFDLSVKVTHWLRKTDANVDTTAGGVDLGTLALINGDSDGNNHVGLGDLSRVLGNWGGTDPMADLDGNGTVGFGDLSIVLGNYNLVGDP